MVRRDRLIDWLDDELNIQHYMEHGDSFNGALVRGTDDVQRVGLCTNTTFETIQHASDQGCDLTISHHGGWERFDQDLLPRKKQEIEEHDMTWYIAHAALDCADSYGVAAQLAKKLGIEIDGRHAQYDGGYAGRYGHLKIPTGEFLDRLGQIDDYNVHGSIDTLEDSRIGVIGGSGGVYPELIRDTVEKGCDVLVTGNASFFGEIYAHEKGITLITLDETSSERWGVYALGDRIEDRFTQVETVRLEETNW